MAKDLLLDIITYLTDQGKVSGAAVDAFYGTMPDDPDNLVVLLEYPGLASPVANFDSRSCQVNVRNKSAELARVKIWSIYNLFHPEDTEDRQIALTGTRWSIISCRQPPFILREDENKRTVYVFNMGVLTHYDE